MRFPHWAVPARQKRNRNKRNPHAPCQVLGKRASFCFVRFLFALIFCSIFLLYFFALFFYSVFLLYFFALFFAPVSFYPAAFLFSLFSWNDWIAFPADRTALPVIPRLRPPAVPLSASPCLPLTAFHKMLRSSSAPAALHRHKQS